MNGTYADGRTPVIFSGVPIFQEVVLRVIEQARKQELANVLAYAYRVADSVVFAQARRLEPVELLEETLVSDLPLADGTLQTKERAVLFQRALENLTPLQREVFLKRYLEGKSRETIAQEMRLSIEAVKKHFVRSMTEMTRAVEVHARPAADNDKDGRRHGR